MPTPPASNNPYESPTTEQAGRKVPVDWYRRLFIVAGGFCVLVATLLTIAAVVGMRLAVEKLKTSTSPNPLDLASEIRSYTLFLDPVVPLVIVGGVLMVIGFRFCKREP